MAYKLSRDFRREEDRLIARIDVAGVRDQSRGQFIPKYRRRSEAIAWRIPLVELVPSLPSMLTGMMA